jgi:hypothetical protein
VHYRSRGERICCRSRGREILRGRQHTHLGPLHTPVSPLCTLLLVLSLTTEIHQGIKKPATEVTGLNMDTLLFLFLKETRTPSNSHFLWAWCFSRHCFVQYFCSFNLVAGRQVTADSTQQGKGEPSLDSSTF